MRGLHVQRYNAAGLVWERHPVAAACRKLLKTLSSSLSRSLSVFRARRLKLIPLSSPRSVFFSFCGRAFRDELELACEEIVNRAVQTGGGGGDGAEMRGMWRVFATHRARSMYEGIYTCGFLIYFTAPSEER